MNSIEEQNMSILFAICITLTGVKCSSPIEKLPNDKSSLEGTNQNETEIVYSTLEQPLKLMEDMDASRVDIKEVFRSVCKSQVDVLCIKLSLILLVDKLASRPTSIEIYPGVSIQQTEYNATRWGGGGGGDGGSSSPVNPVFSRQLTRVTLESPEKLDEVVLSSIHEYLQSLSLNIHILDSNQLQKFRRFGEEALPTLIANNQEQNTGRGKNKGYGGVAMAGLITGGSMLALALSGLAAMAGKALMTALMAMMMALVCLLKGHGGGGGGGGGKSSHYEVITHPYLSKEQTHSAEFTANDQGIYHSHAVGRAFEILNQTKRGDAPGFEYPVYRDDNERERREAYPTIRRRSSLEERVTGNGNGHGNYQPRSLDSGQRTEDLSALPADDFLSLMLV